MESGQYEVAIQEYTAGLQAARSTSIWTNNSRQTAELWSSLSEAHFRMESFEKAQECATTAVNTDRTWYKAGHAYGCVCARVCPHEIFVICRSYYFSGIKKKKKKKEEEEEEEEEEGEEEEEEEEEGISPS